MIDKLINTKSTANGQDAGKEMIRFQKNYSEIERTNACDKKLLQKLISSDIQLMRGVTCTTGMDKEFS